MAESEGHKDQTVSITVVAPGAIFGHYRILRALGTGAMGQIFLAEDIHLKRRVALKFLSPHLASDVSLKARFTREAQAAAAINHPNIVTVFGVAEQHGRSYIAMEYVDGKSLREIIDSGALTTGQTIDLALQVCDGLSFAHAAGLVHRDIKPMNLMIDQSGRLRILDFGLAKDNSDDQLTQAGTALGTVNYMSPEQAQGMEADHRSDIFAVGVVLYEMLTGAVPFKKGNVPATLHSIVADQPPPIRTDGDPLRQQLLPIVARALAKDIQKRYQAIAEMAGDLHQLLPSQRSRFDITITRSTPTVTPLRSLAVLHLHNLGAPEDDYICYGITEDLIVDLTRIGTIRVAPMRAVLKFKDSDADLEEIAARLKTDLVLDGSIRRTQDAIKISVQLVDVANGSNVWADRWEEPLANLPNIKKALIEGIGASLNIGQTVFAQAKAAAQTTKNADAYEMYLKGKYAFQKKHSAADVDTALSLYRQALSQEPGLLAARAGMAEVLIYKGELSSASLELQIAADSPAVRNHPTDQARLLRLQALVNVQQSNWPQAEDLATRAVKMARIQGDWEAEAEAVGVLISALQPQSKFDEALRLFDRVLEIGRKFEDHEKIAEALKNMGVVYARKGEYSRAVELYEEALELARKQDDLSLQAACLSNIGNVYFFQGDLDRAFTHYGEALTINNEIGNRAGTARQNLNMGLIQLQRGNHKEGQELLKVSASFFEALGDRSNLAITLSNLSETSLMVGDIDGAIEHADRALAIAVEIESPLARSTAHHRLGMANFIRGNYELSSEHLTAALEIATANNMKRNIAGLEVELARLHFCQGQLDNAAGHARRAQTLAQEIGDKNTLCLASAYLGALSAAGGLYHAGVRQLDQQSKTARGLGDATLERHISFLLGKTLFQLGNDDDKTRGRGLLEAIRSSAKESLRSCEALQIDKLLAG